MVCHPSLSSTASTLSVLIAKLMVLQTLGS